MSLPTPKRALSNRQAFLVIGALGLIAILGASLVLAGKYLKPAPTTVSLDPKDSAKEVPVNGRLTFTFSRPVSPTVVEASLRIEPALDGALSVGADGRHLAWGPTGHWADLTTYSVTLLPLRDISGNQIGTKRWRFTTTIVPRVVGLTTDRGTATTDGAQLPLGSSLKISFNTHMDTATVTIAINSKATALSWSADGMDATFSTKGISAGPLSIELSPGAMDSLKHRVTTEWKLQLNLVFSVNEHTVTLQAPAVVQIPNDNYGARDQSGLQAASIIYEYLTEGGVTRLSAIFTSVPDVVGPIRSGRLISFKLTRHYHGINYFSGLSSGNFAVLTRDGVPTLFDTQGYYYRSPDRAPPNNLYMKGESIRQYEDKSAPPYAIQTGAPQALSGPDAPTVNVPAHGSQYTYDSTTGTYLKTEDGKPMNDALINEPIHIQLLIVMHARETITNIVEDVGGAHGRDFDMESGGAAEFYLSGKMQSGSWLAPDRASPIAFRLDNGQTLTLPHNLVWIDVVGG